jgi:hypothetical protein
MGACGNPPALAYDRSGKGLAPLGARFRRLGPAGVVCLNAQQY